MREVIEILDDDPCGWRISMEVINLADSEDDEPCVPLDRAAMADVEPRVGALVRAESADRPRLDDGRERAHDQPCADDGRDRARSAEREPRIFDACLEESRVDSDCDDDEDCEPTARSKSTLKKQRPAEDREGPRCENMNPPACGYVLRDLRARSPASGSFSTERELRRRGDGGARRRERLCVGCGHSRGVLHFRGGRVGGGVAWGGVLGG